ncbi:MAG TPA: alpha/beta hydrolase fold domain-containing protein [Verrucomicrobiae bacterium]|nr:alpha/beta hydrolase fold domain-containing protein [Verrucomicrobiae bacterium]
MRERGFVTRNFRRCLFGVVALAAGDIAVIGAAPGANFYVSATGDDSNPGTAEKPFASLTRARGAIRELKKAGPLPAGGATVLVREGTYELAGTFKLDATDSGTETAPIVYRAFPGEKVVLIGGREITGFGPHKGSIIRVDVGALGITNPFRELFFGGKRMPLARYPNFDASNPYAGGFAYVDGRVPKDSEKYKERPEYPAREILCKASDVRSWAHPEFGEVIYFPWHNWMNISVPIASFDKDRRTIVLARDAKTHEGYPGGIRPGDRYYVRDLFEELDSPGEWYLDRETRTLYLWPPAPIKGTTITVPTMDNLIEVGTGVAWITIRGFSMECCDGYAVVFRGTRNCVVAANAIRNSGGGRIGGGGGVFVDGGEKCGVVGNDISEVGNTAITLRGGDPNTLAPGGHYADNNYLHHIGVLNGHGHGVKLEGVGLRVSHNLIHDITRSSIFGGGNDCVVEFNHLRHDNLVTEDTAGFYTGGNWHVRGYVIRYNYVHDVLGYGRRGGRWVSPNFAWGIYLDDDHSGAQVYGNIVARTPLGGVMVHAGRDNVVENNVIIDCARQQFVMSGHDPTYHQWLIEKHKASFVKFQRNPAYAKYPAVPALNPETAWQMVGNKFCRNIVSYRSPQAKLYQRTGDRFDAENESDHNLVWHFGRPILINQTGPKDVAKEQSWETWQRRGFDAHSVVADPLFVDPDKGDYRLRADSPAFKLGFKAIPVEKIGPYADELRASWPIVEAEGVRENPLPAEMGSLWLDEAPVGDGTYELTDAPITVYLPAPDRATGAAVVICPGGGYMRHVTAREGHPIAHWLIRHGIAAIILEYRLPNSRPFVPLLDAQRAIGTVRSRAAEWNVDPSRIGIMGFSAGGHLASAAGTHFDAGDPKAPDPIDRVSCRPDFMILVYPVITMTAKTHAGSKANLLGPDPKPELIELFSNERQVSENTPPAFLAHAKDDVAVPPDNSRMFADAMRAHGIAVEYLELPSGGHGFNGCQGPVWETWKKAALEWLAARGYSRLSEGPAGTQANR